MFLNCKLLKLSQDEINNLNFPITIKNAKILI